MKTRAQAAVEYLIILAVVIIIALVVVGVLGGFPALTRGISERDSAAYWSGAEVAITRYSSTTTGGTNIVVRNNKNFNLRLSFLNLSDTAGTATANMSLSPFNTTAAAGVLAPGESATIAHPKNCTAGPYSFNVVIGYTDPQFGTSYTFTGQKPLVGTCQ